jgi:hypothetical protein
MVSRLYGSGRPRMWRSGERWSQNSQICDDFDVKRASQKETAKAASIDMLFARKVKNVVI